MSYIDKIKKSDTTYDIHDSRVPVVNGEADDFLMIIASGHDNVQGDYQLVNPYNYFDYLVPRCKVNVPYADFASLISASDMSSITETQFTRISFNPLARLCDIEIVVENPDPNSDPILDTNSTLVRGEFSTTSGSQYATYSGIGSVRVAGTTLVILCDMVLQEDGTSVCQITKVGPTTSVN